MTPRYKLPYHGIKLSFSTQSRDILIHHYELNRWKFDLSDDEVAHIQLNAKVGDVLTVSVELDAFNWKGADWLALVISESSEKTPLVFFVPRRLMETSGHRTATSLFWRYEDGKLTSDRMALTFKALPKSGAPNPADGWSRLHWRCFGQFRIKFYRLRAVDAFQPEGKSANQLFGNLRLGDRLRTSLPGQTRSTGIDDLWLERRTITVCSDQPKIRGLRFTPWNSAADNIVVHYRTEAWSCYADVKNVEEEVDGPQGQLRVPASCQTISDSFCAPHDDHGVSLHDPMELSIDDQNLQTEPILDQDSHSVLYDDENSMQPPAAPMSMPLSSSEGVATTIESTDNESDMAFFCPDADIPEELISPLPSTRLPSREAIVGQESHTHVKQDVVEEDADEQPEVNLLSSCTVVGEKRVHDIAFGSLMSELAALSTRINHFMNELSHRDGSNPENLANIENRVRQLAQAISEEMEDLANKEVDALSLEFEQLRNKRRCGGL